MTNMEIRVEKIGASEIEIIRSLAYEIWPEAYKFILKQDQINYMLEQMYSIVHLENDVKNGVQYFVAYEGKEPVGFAGAALEYEPHVLQLHKIYVLPRLKGTGVGKKLLINVRGWGLEHQQKYIRLTVNRNNKEAIGFYQKQGFTILESVDVAIGNEYYMNDYIMKVHL